MLNGNRFQYVQEEEIGVLLQMLPIREIRRSGKERIDIYFVLDAKLDWRTIGRLLIANGRCRNRGIQLIAHCCEKMQKEMIELGLERLIWIEGGKKMGERFSPPS
ncbi:MAG: hypothetical protein AB1656_17525 [Candidatus Omnitrophota bacterium]